MRKILTLALCACAIAAAHADETAAQPPAPPSFIERSFGGVEAVLERSLNYIGVRYQRGGSSPETGFDCSGFVKYLYDETLGLVLPHNAKAIAQQGERVEKTELQPGDLVFFNTMRRAFSHVGIYLGDGRFIHAPRTGKRVRVEDMTSRYWSRRFNGARRVQP
ncbi:MAG: C40 family peptidase [Sulfuritalea sp.]|nr:C40 family peptidase [Sulfuritalea sp.]